MHCHHANGARLQRKCITRRHFDTRNVLPLQPFLRLVFMYIQFVCLAWPSSYGFDSLNESAWTRFILYWGEVDSHWQCFLFNVSFDVLGIELKIFHSNLHTVLCTRVDSDTVQKMSYPTRSGNPRKKTFFGRT